MSGARSKSANNAVKLDTPQVKRQKVESTTTVSKTGQPIQLKPEQAIAIDGKKMYVSEVCTPAPALTCLSNTSQFSFIIENDAVGLINDCILRFQI